MYSLIKSLFHSKEKNKNTPENTPQNPLENPLENTPPNPPGNTCIIKFESNPSLIPKNKPSVTFEDQEKIKHEPRLHVKNCTRNTKINKVFIVIDRNTHDPLGVFNDFEKAKESGEKITYNNCTIIPFTINDPCKYLFKPVFESN